MNRIQHAEQHGSPEWLALRTKFIGASEIGAVMGLSKKTTRTEVLKAKKFGIDKEFSDYVQKRILDKGHEIEAATRSIAEGIVGDDLYPTVWSYGPLLASCDGLNMMETIGWENKSYNVKYFNQVLNGEVPEEHIPQVQQCLLVTGAEKWLFTIGNGTEDGTAYVWVYPDQEWFDRINAAAEQFWKDLEEFEISPEIISAQATLVDDLLLPSIVVTGQIVVESNLELFGDVLHEFIGRINVKPQTDEDFLNIGKAIKALEKAEKWLDQQEESAISRFDQLNQAITLKNSLKELARENRLILKKIDQAEKESRKAAIVGNAKSALTHHMQMLQAEVPVAFTLAAVNFADAIKGKQRLDVMQDAVNTMLANAKIEADALARDLREKHTWYIENAGEHSFLFSDLSSLIYKPADDFKAVAENRIAQHKEQERIKTEQAAKAQAEREEQIRREAEEKAQRDAAERERMIAEQSAKAERDRIAAEQKAKDDLIATEQEAERKRIEAENIAAHDQMIANEFVDRIVEANAKDKATAIKFPDVPEYFDSFVVEFVSQSYGVDHQIAFNWLTESFSRQAA